MLWDIVKDNQHSVPQKICSVKQNPSTLKCLNGAALPACLI